MAIGLATALRTTRMEAVVDAIDAGSGAGKLRIYDGTRPATGGAATTLLAEITLNDPCGTVTDGVLTFDVDPALADSSASASGTATWARIVTAADDFVADMSAGTSGTDIIMNTAAVLSGGPVSVLSAVLTEGNA